jgi:anti-sigma regulatory factor (Ser/Thr protein kinase)
MVELRRHFSGTPQMVSEMRDFVRDGCRRVWARPSDNSAISQLELAVSEAASNIILHGLQGNSGELIKVTLNVEIRQACVTFVYPGCAFSPQTVPAPDFTGCAESGYGLYLIQQSVDEVHFSRDDAGYCTIRFVKKRSTCT